MGLLLAGGVTPRDAAWACDILPLFITAAAVETATYQERGDEQDASPASSRRCSAPCRRSASPTSARHGDDLISGDGE